VFPKPEFLSAARRVIRQRATHDGSPEATEIDIP